MSREELKREAIESSKEAISRRIRDIFLSRAGCLLTLDDDEKDKVLKELDEHIASEGRKWKEKTEQMSSTEVAMTMLSIMLQELSIMLQDESPEDVMNGLKNVAEEHELDIFE